MIAPCNTELVYNVLDFGANGMVSMTMLRSSGLLLLLPMSLRRPKIQAASFSFLLVYTCASHLYHLLAARGSGAVTGGLAGTTVLAYQSSGTGSLIDATGSQRFTIESIFVGYLSEFTGVLLDLSNGSALSLISRCQFALYPVSGSATASSCIFWTIR